MSTNSVMFTALPSGVVSATSSGTVVSLSVYVTPQLAAAASITSVPAFANWPKTVAGLGWTVTLTAGTTAHPIAATLDPRYAAGRFDQSLWAAIFGSGTSPVAVNQFAVKNYTASGVLSYGAAPISSTVKSTYKALAPLTTKPTISKGGTDVLSSTTANVAASLNVPQTAGSATLANAGQVVMSTVKSAIGPTAASLSKTALQALQKSGQVPTTSAGEFARVAAYHNRKNYRNIQPVAAAGSTSTVTLDFHQIVGHLSDHPAILRRLGLIVDLEITIPAGLGIDGPVNVSVAPSSAVAGLSYGTPFTYTILHPYGSASAVAFRPYYGDVDGAGALTPLIDTNGLVWLDNIGLLTVDDLDVDHAAIHVANYAEQAQKDLATAAQSGASSIQVTLPALRTTGLALHHTDREALVGLRFANNATWTSGNTFVAEDFLRGFRVDVRTVTTVNGVTTYGPWSSLCKRQSTFTFDNGYALAPVVDEGYVKASGMSSSSSDAVYNVHEALFHWDGWSLVAARPGLSVGAPSATTDGTTVTDTPVLPSNSGDKLNLPFTNQIVPQKGSLTKLRFGTSYQFRVRAVDLAGNDMALAAASDNTRPHASPVTPFSRYEPVSPPTLQLRKALTEGESVERLVIRSDPYGPTPLNATQWAQKHSAAPAGTATANAGMNAYWPTCERHVAPPKTSVQTAEWHGAFDAALAKVTPASYVQTSWALASKEDGGFYDATVTDTSTGQYRTYTQPGRLIVTPPFSQALVNQAAAAHQPTFTGTQDITPRGTALQSGQYVIFDADSVMLPYLPDPNAAGVALQGLPTGSPAYRTYGARVANPSGGVWPELAVWRLVLQESSTSSTTVTGLDPASASTPVVVSLPHATEIAITYSSTVNAPTAHAFCPTAASDQANAQKGLLPMISPQRTITLVHAVQHPAPPGLTDGDIVPSDRKPNETTQSILATYRFDGASSARVDLIASWQDYVDQAGVADPTQPIPHSGVIDSITPNASDTLVQNKTVRQLFGDTRRRDITYTTKATTRFREYFPASITSDSANITNAKSLGGTLTCNSSARPPVPKVLYAVPSFTFTSGWSASPPTATSTRSGGIVRVYVDRPWYATGTGECLGVVLAAQPADVNRLASLVSQWGNDPIWYRGALGALDITHVNRATCAGIYPNVALAEGLGYVNIAAFAPSFNAQRGLWYFDIGLNTDQAYFPFLRLALVRYQPGSIFDPSDSTGVAKLDASSVVLAEFVQLSATRTASVVDNGGGNYNVSVSGLTAPNTGAAGTSPLTAASGHTVTAEFQEATTASPDDIDWYTIGAPTVLNPSSLSGNSVTYTSALVFPSYAATSGTKHRILVKEYEVYSADPQAGVEQGVGVVTIGQSNRPYTQRIVYADAIAISI
jgi:hypothetical protein